MTAEIWCTETTRGEQQVASNFNNAGPPRTSEKSYLNYRKKGFSSRVVVLLEKCMTS